MPHTLPRRLFGTSSLYLALLAGLSGLGATGCPGSLDPALLQPTGGAGMGGGGSTGTCDAAPLLATKCGMTICHEPTVVSAGGLDLTSAGVAARLLDVVPTGDQASQCGGQGAYLVRGSTPAMGLLLTKITNTPPCGSPMPTLGALNPDDVACITEWANSLTMP